MKHIIRQILLSGGGLVAQIMTLFRTRVLGLGGITEATTCAEGTLNAINNANLLQQSTFVMAASGYKSGVIYPQVPNSNSNGDLTFTRSSTATRVNSSGMIESIASGVPSLDYSQGTCPTFLFEPQRRNLLLNTLFAGGGSSPTSWSQPNAGSGTSSPVSSIYGNSDGAIAYLQSATSQRPFINQGFTTLANVVYCYSFYVESFSATTTQMRMMDVIDVGNILTGQTITYYINGVQVTSTTNITNGKLSILITSTSGGIQYFRCGIGCSGGISGTQTLQFSRPQLEDNGSGGSASYPTSYIPTTGATATRTVSSFTRNNVYTNGLISASGGTWFVELKNNLSIKGDIASSIYGLYIGDSSSAPSNAISIQNDNTTNRAKITTIASGTPTNRYTTSAASVKLAIVFNGSTLSIFENGVKQVNGIAFTPTISGYENLCDVNTDVSKFIRSMALWNTPLSDAQCIALTTP